jgi:hypothetical protein
MIACMVETATIGAPAIVTDKNSWLSKLSAAMQTSDAALKDFRQNRFELVENYAGDWYGKNRKNKKRRPFNQLFAHLATLMPMCCPRKVTGQVGDATLGDPTGKFSEDDERYSFALRFQSMLDRICNERIRLPDVLRMMFFDAQFGLGIVKIGKRPSGQFADDNTDHGEYYVAPVDLDDYVVEMGVKKRELITFESDSYAASYDDLYNGDLLDGDAKDALKNYKQNLPPAKTDQVAGLSGQIAQSNDWNDLIGLRDIYLPKQGRIITTLANYSAMARELLSWELPPELKDGLYDTLAFYPISSNIMPIPPALTFRDMDSAINRLVNKAVRQAERQKDNIVVQVEGRKLGDTLKNANDGDVLVGDATKAGVLSTTGMNPQAIQAIQFLMQLANNVNGNMDLLGGINQASDRVTTNQMLMGNANLRTADLRSAVSEVGARIYRRLAYFCWNDGDLKSDLSIKADNGAVYRQSRWTPQNRVGQFSDYCFGLNVYPGPDEAPEQRYKVMAQWARDFLLPLAAMAQDPAVAKILRESGRLAGIPYVESLFANPQSAAQIASMMPGQASQPSTSPNVNITAGGGGGMEQAGMPRQMQQRQQQQGQQAQQVAASAGTQ